MATVSWDEKGIVPLESMVQKTTITGQTYANTITALREAIKEKRWGKISAGVLLLHDNAPVHLSAKSQTAIRQCGFQQVNHPPYSPDLAPSDYFLFRGVNDFQAMKKSRRRSRPGLKSSQKIFLFRGDKVVATKVGEVYWVIGGLHWKIKNIFSLVISCFFLTQVDILLAVLAVKRYECEAKHLSQFTAEF